jgi:hypothetical protein
MTGTWDTRLKLRHGNDVHVFEPGGIGGHVIGEPHVCRCEPTCPYIERTPEGYIWRRVIIHGSLKSRN